MGAKLIFTKEFKERAVELTWSTDREQSDIAAELEINENMLAGGNRKLCKPMGACPDTTRNLKGKL